jgi:dTDP-4-dehydrorhamnose reductase
VRVLVTGVNGQLGWDVAKRLAPEHVVISFDKKKMDLATPSIIGGLLSKEEPDIIVHCGAYTMVDKAEEEKELCHKINAEATRAIAEEASQNGTRLIFISTDYVFDGTKPEPYETDDRPNPINYYGLTKLEGELAVKELVKKHQIIRTSWVFGTNGGNFVKTIIRLGKEQEILRVVTDQVGSPTYTVDLAELIFQMVRSDRYGTYHATNEGYCSWHRFATEIVQIKGWKNRVEPIVTEDNPKKAHRPKNSRLSKRSLDDAGFQRLPGWQNALERYMHEAKEVGR